MDYRKDITIIQEIIIFRCKTTYFFIFSNALNLFGECHQIFL